MQDTLLDAAARAASAGAYEEAANLVALANRLLHVGFIAEFKREVT